METKLHPDVAYWFGVSVAFLAASMVRADAETLYKAGLLSAGICVVLGRRTRRPVEPNPPVYKAKSIEEAVEIIAEGFRRAHTTPAD